MKSSTFLIATGIILLCVSAGFLPAQQSSDVTPPGRSPLFRLTVVERSAKAINYQYRSDPTMIDFKGTVILPRARGGATVQSLQGRTRIDAQFEGLESPQRYGREYLTYVLWAITPDGRPHNMGELIPDASNKAKIDATTDLQAFALIVTAEPYAAVRQPGNVVIAENEIRPDTVGKIEPLEVKYELLPRGEYTWIKPADSGDFAVAHAPKVSMHEYEAQMELYQAQNAIAIASAAQAGNYASDTLAKAQLLLTTAEQIHDRKGDYRTVVQNARESAEAAEDARAIAVRRQQDDQLKTSNQELARTQAALASAKAGEQAALASAQQAQDQARAQAEQFAAQSKADQQARIAAEADAAAARQQATARAEAPAPTHEEHADDTLRRERRERILASLKTAMPTLDTGRGLVVTLHDDSFRGPELRDDYTGPLTRIASIVAAEPGLHVVLEGYSDTEAAEGKAQERAEGVKRVLIRGGLPSSIVTAAGLGATRPVESNSTPEGRRANSRVEIIVSGDPIGNMPLWDHPYRLTSNTARPEGAR